MPCLRCEFMKRISVGVLLFSPLMRQTRLAVLAEMNNLNCNTTHFPDAGIAFCGTKSHPAVDGMHKT